jgi:hypothetical protein
METLTGKLNIYKHDNDRLDVVDFAVVAPQKFSRHEKEYISKRLPFSGDNLGAAAVHWAARVGQKDRMCRIVKKFGQPESRVQFAWLHDNYKSEMKETINSSAGALLWADRFPEDRKEMKRLIGGGEYAFRWAKRIGNEDEMEDRITIRYWQMKFDKEIRGDESVSFT